MSYCWKSLSDFTDQKLAMSYLSFQSAKKMGIKPTPVWIPNSIFPIQGDFVYQIGDEYFIDFNRYKDYMLHAK